MARQIKVSISRVGGKPIEAVLQVQTNAPVDLLLGTDLQSRLGFVLMSVEHGGIGRDLLLQKQWRVNSPVADAPPFSILAALQPIVPAENGED